jgi:hypothetical protein
LRPGCLGLRCDPTAEIYALIRHCEPTGRRKAPPDDRLREAIQGNKQELDCFVARAPRNDGDNARNELTPPETHHLGQLQLMGSVSLHQSYELARTDPDNRRFRDCSITGRDGDVKTDANDPTRKSIACNRCYIQGSGKCSCCNARWTAGRAIMRCMYGPICGQLAPGRCIPRDHRQSVTA